VTSRIEDAYRVDAGRILGAVVASTGDLQLAEDAVQDAFLRALAQERSGARLDNPAAWITTAARRIAIDYVRRAQTASRALPALAFEARRPVHGSTWEDDMSAFAFTGDERLELILTVCHPDVAEETRLALALRFACGLPTRDVAAVLLVSEATMAARLTRAKKRLHDSPIRFAMDDDTQVRDRLGDALTVLYLVYTAGYAAPAADTSGSLRRDAVDLARDALRIRPGEAEASGLLGLLLLTEARQATRLDPAGELVDLATADRTAWDQALIAEGEALAARALGAGTGRFALQAGIAGLHDIAPTWEATDWSSIARLYDGLVAVWPSPSARLARLVARGHSAGVGPEAARLELDSDDALFDGVLSAQAFAARAEMGARCGDRAASAADYAEALRRETDPIAQRYLQRRIAALG
jgi:RNA polymerase sigma-70 factor (ECF subfamily)